MAGIYLHIPFCKQACTYCDFYFETSQKHHGGFTNRLIQEIEFRSAEAPAFTRQTVDTIYLGGGTPSQLSVDELGRILKAVRNTFEVSRDAEITIEMNPDDISEKVLDGLLKAGINRISMGVQTFNEDRLRFMNRAHDKNEALNALRLLQQSGVKSWTADLIYGNPGQDDEDLLRDTDTLLSFDPPHISAYTLTVEPHTRLGSLVRKSIVKPAEDDTVAHQVKLLTDRLADAGLERYEVSNFARKGHKSRHNSAYWRHTDYLGLGPSAHSFMWDDDRKTARRWSNQAKLASWMNPEINFERHQEEQLTLQELAEERLLIGLRTLHGVEVTELEKRYNYSLTKKQTDWLEELTEGSFISPDWKSGQRTIRLTQSGLLLSDYIALNLIQRKL